MKTKTNTAPLKVVDEGNGDDPEASAERRKAEYAALEGDEPEAKIEAEDFSEQESKITAEADEAKPGIPDPLDLTALRINPSTQSTKVGRVLRVLTGRPGKQDFFRVHPDPSYRMTFGMIELKEDGEDYLVTPDLVPLLPGEVVFKMMYTTLNRAGVIRLWSVRIPSADDRGQFTTWWTSGHEGAALAVDKWVRLVPSRALGGYEIMYAEGAIPDPDWSAVPSFKELLLSGYGQRCINTIDHAVIKALRGQG
jgi:hypothetical protein